MITCTYYFYDYVYGAKVKFPPLWPFLANSIPLLLSYFYKSTEYEKKAIKAVELTNSSFSSWDILVMATWKHVRVHLVYSTFFQTGRFFVHIIVNNEFHTEQT